MSKKSFDPRECIGPLNNIKQVMQTTERPFTKNDMINSFKSCGLPTNSTFWSIFKNSGILQEVSKGKFMFASKEPIYIGLLNTIKTKYREIIHRYTSNKPIVEVPEQVIEVDSIQNAIDLLKKQGYQIFAPVGIVYKQL